MFFLSNFMRLKNSGKKIGKRKLAVVFEENTIMLKCTKH